MRDAVGDRYATGSARWLWPSLALPGVVWLVIWVLVPTYAVLAMAMGQVDDLLLPQPAWNPADWNIGYLNQAFHEALPGGTLWPPVRNTLEFVAASVALCLLIGYPVAYYVARRAGRLKGLLLVLLVLPFWVSYLMRMLAWIGLLAPDGWVNRALHGVGIIGSPYPWLDGRPLSVILALVYGYIPYLILPLYAALDRIDQRVLEAARDLGASAFWTFVRVTLPLSRQGILAGTVLIALPMFGDYYTNDLVSASPNTNMLGNQINLFTQGGPQQNLGAALVVVMMALLLVLMSYYVVATARETRRAR